MIEGDNKFRILNGKEKSQYKFSFCEQCCFYECELVNGYEQFKVNYMNDSVPKNNIEESIPTAKVTKVIVDGVEMDYPSYQDMFQLESDSKQAESNMDILSYNSNELKQGCFMHWRFNQKECGRKWVANGIGDDFKIGIRRNFKIESDDDKWEPGNPNKWEPKQAVFISAQTGQGKNTFIEDTLIPYVRKLNHEKEAAQKVLIISNRISLRIQIEGRIKDAYGEYADVKSYQSLLNEIEELKKIQKHKHSAYTYVICDEAHFFTSDAMFNPDTEKILSAIVQTFQSAIRIYMSATPYECLEYIEKYEGKYVAQPVTSVLYHFKRDYSYLDVKYYFHHSELIGSIVESVNNKGEKWLIFIDDMDKIQDFKSTLEDYPNMKGKVFTIDAGSKSKKEYYDLVLKEKFPDKRKVLIATSVIDNGVNFWGIQNVVVSDMSKTKCLQMVGRARVRNGDETVTLYLKRFDEKHVESRIKNLEKQEDAYYDYSQIPRSVNAREKFIFKYLRNNENDWLNGKHWFGKTRQPQLALQNEIYPNEIACSMLSRLLDEHRAILEEMKRTDEGQPFSGQRYLEYQLSWFGKRYDVSNDITLADKSKSENEFIAFLDSYADNEKHISKEDQEKFKAEFTKLFDIAFQRQDPNKDRDYGIDKMNKLLLERNIGYKVKSDREKEAPRPTYWVVVKFDGKAVEAEGC